jgi:hypothetical protein
MDLIVDADMVCNWRRESSYTEAFSIMQVVLFGFGLACDVEHGMILVNGDAQIV